MHKIYISVAILPQGASARARATAAPCAPPAAMLEDAPPEQVARWQSVPEDGQWYALDGPTVIAADPFCANGWPNLASGHGQWKLTMQQPVSEYVALLQIFGVEAFCDLCPTGGWPDFVAHATAQQHFNAVYQAVEDAGEAACENLWHETRVPGGCVRFNHLSGELQALRRCLGQEVASLAVQALPRAHEWMPVAHQACVATWPGEKDAWPNLWSHRHWKQKMERPVRKATQVLEANGILRSARCQYCQES